LILFRDGAAFLFYQKACKLVSVETTTNKKIVLLGTGNLAWHLGPALADCGYTILQVYGRSAASAKSLARRMEVNWTDDPGRLDENADILLYCVSDKAIPALMCRMDMNRRPVMIHTAGSVPSDVFGGICRDFGVLYPIMTFTKDREIDFSGIPLCVEASSELSWHIIEEMAGRLSKKVYRLNSDERKIMHLAGIIASNFSNHMFHLSAEYLKDKGLAFDLLKPLIRETALKVMELDPAAAQTGPARRNDTGVVREHIDLLKDQTELQKLYTFVSDSISNHFRT
jgi:predicted short-subunit dehydrogenase-like oxidoreductase (DUF2520 family)